MANDNRRPLFLQIDTRYSSTCKYCGETIYWGKYKGRPAAADRHGKFHFCKNKYIKTFKIPSVDEGLRFPIPNPIPEPEEEGPTCRHCKGQIRWKKVDNKWVSHTLQGKLHQCLKKIKPPKVMGSLIEQPRYKGIFS